MHPLIVLYADNRCTLQLNRLGIEPICGVLVAWVYNQGKTNDRGYRLASARRAAWHVGGITRFAMRIAVAADHAGGAKCRSAVSV
jgi:hypothetical protein